MDATYQGEPPAAWWRRLATSYLPEGVFFGVLLIIAVGLVLSGTRVLPLDTQVAVPLYATAMAFEACWIATLRIGLPLRQGIRWLLWPQPPRDVRYWVGYMLAMVSMCCIPVLLLNFGGAIFPVVIAVFLIGCAAGIALATAGSHAREAIPHPRLARILSLGLLVVTLLTIGWYVREAPVLFPDYMLGGPTQQVTVMAWSPDGRALAALGQNTPLTIWSTVTHQPVQHLPCTSDWGGHLAWSADATYLAATCTHRSHTGENYTTTIWDVTTGGVVATFTSAEWADGLSWSHASDVLATVRDDDTSSSIVLYDVASRRQVASYPLADQGYGSSQIAWSPDGRSLAVMNDDVRVFDASTGKLVRTLMSHEEGVIPESIAWSSDGGKLFIASTVTTEPNGTYMFPLRIDAWDARTGAERSSVVVPASIDISPQIAWSPGGQALVLAEEGPSPTFTPVYDARTGHVLFTWRGQSGANVLAWSPDGRAVASANYSGWIAVWHPALGTS